MRFSSLFQHCDLLENDVCFAANFEGISVTPIFVRLNSSLAGNTFLDKMQYREFLGLLTVEQFRHHTAENTRHYWHSLT